MAGKLNGTTAWITIGIVIGSGLIAATLYTGATAATAEDASRRVGEVERAQQNIVGLLNRIDRRQLLLGERQLRIMEKLKIVDPQ